MRIDGSGFEVPKSLRVDKAQMNAAAQKAAASSSARSGKSLELSSKGEEIRVATKALNQLPEARMDKVNRLKKEIQEGRYKIDPEKVADGILSLFMGPERLR
ncbi:MAG: flagellar biosynthesis anti-sigma factor FlgM [Armatimonadetes bacterium]|nr:flagellar biosynthesis anti-sigma factor FlgM [Armatimonadota bacterium]